MDWRHDYVDGNVRSSCSICGRSRRFPDSLTFCDDKLFRCESCMEKTALAFDREIAAARQRREQSDVAIGIRPPWEATDSLLTIATDRVANLIPGWTVTDTFSDTFDIVPGGVGSDWAVVDFGTAEVTETDEGVARITCPTNQSLEINRNAFSRSSPTSNRWYSITRFSIEATPDAKTVMYFGWAASPFLFTGVVGSESTTFFTVGVSTGQKRVSDVEIEVGAIYTGEVWSRGDGYLRASINHRPVISVPIPTSIGTIVPVHYSNVLAGVGGGTSRVDLYDTVYFK